MKIKAIDILAFGKHKNLHLEFPDGFTLFYGSNECGKTTLMAFIKMMFYGNTGKSSDIDKNPRKKYRPWNSDIMAGSITFTKEGRCYRLEREFKASNSADKITLIDLDTNEILPLSASGDIGEKFFSLTDGAFERSIFIGEPQFAAKNDAADGEINSKLSVSVLSGEDDASFETVQGRLKASREELLSKSGKIGRLDKAITALSELDERIRIATETEKAAEELKNQISFKEEELSTASKESARLFDLLKSADKIKKRVFLEKYIEAEKDRLSLEEKLTLSDGSIADQKFLSTAHTLCDRINEVENSLKATETELERINKELSELNLSDTPSDSDSTEALQCSIEDADLKIEKVNRQAEELKYAAENTIARKKIRLFPLITGVIMSLLGVIAALLTTYPFLGILVAVMGVLAILSGILFKRTVKTEDPEISRLLTEAAKELSHLLEQKHSLLKELSLAEKDMEEKKLLHSTNEALRKDKTARANAVKAQNKQLSAEYDGLISEFISFMCKLKPCDSTDSAFTVLREAEENIKKLENAAHSVSVLSDNANCRNLAEATEKLSAHNAEGTVVGIDETELENIKEKFKVASDISGRMRSELSALKVRLKAEYEKIESVEVLCRQKIELEKKISAYRHHCDITDCANEALNEAFRELRRNYSGTLDSRTAEIFSALTENRYDGVTVSKNFDIAYSDLEAFGTKESGYLSGGTEDQLYLSLRLALAELICENGEALPIFMDDPLANFDDQRACSALAFLKDYIRERQAIMFTCHSSFADMARELDINIKELRE